MSTRSKRGSETDVQWRERADTNSKELIFIPMNSRDEPCSVHALSPNSDRITIIRSSCLSLTQLQKLYRVTQTKASHLVRRTYHAYKFIIIINILCLIKIKCCVSMWF